MVAAAGPAPTSPLPASSILTWAAAAPAEVPQSLWPALPQQQGVDVPLMRPVSSSGSGAVSLAYAPPGPLSRPSSLGDFMKTSGSGKGGKGSKGRAAEDRRRIQTDVPPPAGPEAASAATASAATASSTALVWLNEVSLGDWVEVQRLDDASSREQGFVAEVRQCCTHHHHRDWVEVQRLDDASSREQGFVAEVRQCCTHHHHRDWVEA